MNFIPCENCNRHIEFERYLEHLESCVEVPSFYFRTSNIIGSNSLPLDFLASLNSILSINILIPDVIPEDLEDVEVGVENVCEVLKDYERKENVCDFCVICDLLYRNKIMKRRRLFLFLHVFCRNKGWREQRTRVNTTDLFIRTD